METLKTERLRELINAVPNELKTLNEEAFKKKPSVDKWSKQEILGHLIDSAINNHQRFLRAQFEVLPDIPYDQNKWNSFNYYNDLDKSQLISFWKGYNIQILELVKRIPQNLLSNTCTKGGTKAYSISFLFDDYVEHLEHHLNQLVDLK